MFKKVKDILRQGEGEVAETRRVPLTPEAAREVGKAFAHMKVWQCVCGAKLQIRTKESREEGKSNFVPYPSSHPKHGHSLLPTQFLNWNGLAEERGWKVEPDVRCPACLEGLTVQEYKLSKRK